MVVHSATKFLGGAGTTLGGVVVESGRFHWANEHFPLFDPRPAYNLSAQPFTVTANGRFRGLCAQNLLH